MKLDLYFHTIEYTKNSIKIIFIKEYKIYKNLFYYVKD